MADDQDDAQKTEDPSAKKLEDAFKKGDVPKSQELKTWFMLFAATILFATAAPSLARDVTEFLRGYMSTVHLVATDGSGLGTTAEAIIKRVLMILSLPMLVFILAGLAGNLIQHKPLITFEKMQPKLNKISPLAGLKRMFSTNTLVEFLKTLAKLVLVSSVAFMIVWPERSMLEGMAAVSLGGVLDIIQIMAFRMLLGVTLLVTVIAALDFAWQKHQHQKKLRMTKQEVKDEFKQTEGDPQIKARLRQVRMDRARTRMMQAVPEADVVITNPTHFAVALVYKHGDMDVPRLVAKGADKVAFRIRDLAEEHDVPIVENPPLTRALYAAVEIDEEVPPEHYKAVAEVIGYVMKLKKAGVRAKSSAG